MTRTRVQDIHNVGKKGGTELGQWVRHVDCYRQDNEHVIHMV